MPKPQRRLPLIEYCRILGVSPSTYRRYEKERYGVNRARRDDRGRRILTRAMARQDAVALYWTWLGRPEAIG